MISQQNPLKKKKTLLADHHRLEMVHRAIGDHPDLKASDIEFKLPQPSYTVTTLAWLSEKYPSSKFALIMGSDNLQSLKKWKNYEVILEHYEIYVYPRPGFDGGELRNHPSVKYTEAPVMEISSTFIREALKNKKDIRFYMPDAAWLYLDEMNFYRK